MIAFLKALGRGILSKANSFDDMIYSFTFAINMLIFFMMFFGVLFVITGDTLLCAWSSYIFRFLLFYIIPFGLLMQITTLEIFLYNENSVKKVFASLIMFTLLSSLTMLLTALAP